MRPKQFGDRKQVTIYLDAAEYEELTERAHGQSLSAYVREMVFGSKTAPRSINLARTMPKKAKRKPTLVRESSVYAPDPDVLNKVLDSKDKCGAPYCGHFRWQHQRGCCTSGDCRCQSFAEAEPVAVQSLP